MLGFAWSYAYGSHTTLVAVPGMIPSVGPMGYVLPLSHTADTVRCVGVTRIEVKFQANVMACEGAILKKEIAVWGGWVMVIPPAAAVAGMEMMELLDWGGRAAMSRI